MCLFCALTPMAASVSVVAHAKLKAGRKEAEEAGKEVPSHLLISEKLTPLLPIGAACTSIVYHTLIAPRLGIWW